MMASSKEKQILGPVGHFGVDSMKMIAESHGIGNMSDDGARQLAEDVSFRVKLVLQEARKYAMHAKRNRVTTKDVDFAMKNLNIEPLFGFDTNDFLPFRYASGGGREVFFNEEKEIDLTEMITSTSLPKLPQDIALKAHWLSIEGEQPAIPENPPPISKDLQRMESVDPATALKNQSLGSNQQQKMQQKKKKHVEMVRVKQYATHELSVEQQLYYKEITEACVGSDEGKRGEALQSLTYDSGLHQMLPRLCTFISEGVKVNVVQNNLALLIYLMRMVKALLDNQTLYLEKYLHEIIPTVLTCIVSKQLCMRPEVDNHWALRDFAARLLAQICKNFNTSTNGIQTRVTRLLSAAVDNDRLPLSSQYGAVSGLCELGPEVHKTFVMKRIKAIGERIRPFIENPNSTMSSADKSAAEHIQTLILRVMPNTIKSVRPPPDILDDYRSEFGYLGVALHKNLIRSRSASNPIIQHVPPQITSSPSYQITSSSSSIRPSQQIQLQRVNPSNSQRLLIVGGQQRPPFASQQGFVRIAPPQNMPTTIGQNIQTRYINRTSSQQQ